MVTKDFILSEIRRLAKEKAGRVGLKAFVAASGIPQSQILGRHWATWNEATLEAGLAAATFGSDKKPDELVVVVTANLIARLQKWPTNNELILARRRDPSFPSLNVFRRLREQPTFLSKLLAHCASHAELEVAKRVVAERMATVTSKDGIASAAASVQGYVYMMRSGRRYKIGRSNSPARRHREVRLDLPDPTSLVHSIPTDDPAGIEAYWHRRFSSMRVRDTEFFELNATDVAAFKRRKYQ